MDNNTGKYREALILTLGELAAALLTVVGFLIADAAFGTGFSYNVVTGAALGATVIIINFLLLSVSVNRAVDRYLTERGNAEMDDETAEKFTQEHSMAIQNSIKTSYIIRTLSMIAAFVLAFLLSDIFNPLATAIPMLAFRPLLSLSEIIRRKHDAEPDKSKFIDYSAEDDSENEKECDN